MSNMVKLVDFPKRYKNSKIVLGLNYVGDFIYFIISFIHLWEFLFFKSNDVIWRAEKTLIFLFLPEFGNFDICSAIFDLSRCIICFSVGSFGKYLSAFFSFFDAIYKIAKVGDCFENLQKYIWRHFVHTFPDQQDFRHIKRTKNIFFSGFNMQCVDLFSKPILERQQLYDFFCSAHANFLHHLFMVGFSIAGEGTLKYCWTWQAYLSQDKIRLHKNDELLCYILKLLKK